MSCYERDRYPRGGMQSFGVVGWHFVVNCHLQAKTWWSCDQRNTCAENASHAVTLMADTGNTFRALYLGFLSPGERHPRERMAVIPGGAQGVEMSS